MTKNDHFLKLSPEDQLGPPLVMKNDHFLKLCPGGHLGPHISDEKCVFGTKNGHFLKLCQEQASYHIFVNMFKELFDKKQCS